MPDDYLKTKIENVKIWLSERWKLMLPSPEEKAAFFALGIPQWQQFTDLTNINKRIINIMIHWNIIVLIKLEWPNETLSCIKFDFNEVNVHLLRENSSNMFEAFFTERAIVM